VFCDRSTDIYTVSGTSVKRIDTMGDARESNDWISHERRGDCEEEES